MGLNAERAFREMMKTGNTPKRKPFKTIITPSAEIKLWVHKDGSVSQLKIYHSHPICVMGYAREWEPSMAIMGI